MHNCSEKAPPPPTATMKMRRRGILFMRNWRGLGHVQYIILFVCQHATILESYRYSADGAEVGYVHQKGTYTDLHICVCIFPELIGDPSDLSLT